MHENNPPNRPETFRAVRELLLSGKIAEANRLAVQLEGRKLNYGTNLPFGDLRLNFDHEKLQARDYRRELDLDCAKARNSIHQSSRAIADCPVFNSAIFY